MSDPANPVLVQAYARAWIGTPWTRRAACRGLGADCVGLVRGLVAEVSALEVEAPAWSSSWAEAPGQPILDAARRILAPWPTWFAPGCVVAFRQARGRVAHVGVATARGVIHATERAGVVEVSARPWPVTAAWAIPCAAGCETGDPEVALDTLTAIVRPAAGLLGWVVEVVDDRGTPLSRSTPHASPDVALAAIPAGIVHVERVD